MQNQFEKSSDKIEHRLEEKTTPSLPSVDRIALMQEAPKQGVDTSAPHLPAMSIEGLDTEVNSSKKPNEQRQKGKVEHGRGSSDGNIEKPVDKNHNAIQPEAPIAKPEPQTTIDKTTTVDNKAPTVAVLDVFKDKNVALDLTTKVSHGEISRAAAEKNGFNTIAINVDQDSNRHIKYRLSDSLNEVADNIKNGDLKLGKGDVLNVSLGLAKPPSFEEASKFLGFPVTRENLASEKEHIKSRLNEISNDPNRSPEERNQAKSAVDTNKAIERIQSFGVEVVKAAGNADPNHFDWSGLSAKHQLSATTPTGKPTNFSAENSATEKGIGVYPIHYNQNADLISPTPIAKQQGSLEIGDTGVKFPAETSTQMVSFAYDPDKTMNRDDLTLTNKQKFQPDSTVLNPELIARPDKAEFNKATEERAERLAASVPMSSLEPQLRYIVKHPIGQKLEPTQQEVNGLITGTSFSNIDYLKRQYDRLKAIKAAK